MGRAIRTAQNLDRARRYAPSHVDEIRLDAQIRVRIARVWLSGNDAFNDDGLLLVVVCGKRHLIQVRLREVVAERTPKSSPPDLTFPQTFLHNF